MDLSKNIPIKFPIHTLNIVNYIIFELSLIIIYILYYNFAFSNNWEIQKKTALDHYTSLSNLFIYSTALYIVGNFEANFNLYSYAGLLFMPFIYGYIAESPLLKFSLASWKSWNNQQWSLMLGFAAIIFSAVGYNIYESYLLKSYIPIIIAFGGFAAVLSAVNFSVNRYNTKVEKKNELTEESDIKAYKDKEGTSEIHLHHWQWAVPLAFMFQNNTVFSSIARGIFTGIFLQGITTYDADRIFDYVLPKTI
jgi:hypothetical protein